VSLQVLREQWVTARPLYEEFAQYVSIVVAEATRARGLSCDVTHRAKEVHSFLKKAIRKSYASPFEEITDKAGVRVIVTFLDSFNAVTGAIEDQFEILKTEDHGNHLSFDRLGYLGKHFDVRLRSEREEATRFAGLRCEIQLHSRAQNLWAEVSHQLSYKGSLNPPAGVQRGIYRLVALVEIFDQSAAQSRQAIVTASGYEEAALLESLEAEYYKVSGRAFDRELSLMILRELKELMLVDGLEVAAGRLSAFAQHHRAKLDELFAEYRDDARAALLLFQPEALAIFEQLETDRFVLRERWNRALPPQLLEELALIWGTPY
jgi:ppGpp synthetase/RelA/SpoT-type nucleotidyltranferase